MHRHRFATALVIAVSLMLVALPTRVSADEIIDLEVDTVLSASSGSHLDVVGSAGGSMIFTETSDSSVRVAAIWPQGSPSSLLVVAELREHGELDDRFLFVADADDPSPDVHLYATTDGFAPVQLGPANPTCFAVADGAGWFAIGDELWRTDGTDIGTGLVAAIDPAAELCGFADGGDGVVFSASDVEHGTELWTSDGMSARLFADVVPGTESSSPTDMVAIGDRVIASTTAGTYTIAPGVDPVQLFAGMPAAPLGVVGGAQLMLVGLSGSRMVWRTDGTFDGTAQLTSFAIDPETWELHGDRLWFDREGDEETFSTDGTVDGTRHEWTGRRSMVSTPYGLWTRGGALDENGALLRDDGTEHAMPPVLGEGDVLDEATVAAGRLWFVLDDFVPCEGFCNAALWHNLAVLAGPPSAPRSVEASTNGSVSWQLPLSNGGRQAVVLITAEPDANWELTGQTSGMFELDAGVEYTISLTASNELGTSDATSVLVAVPENPGEAVPYTADVVADDLRTIVGVVGDGVVYTTGEREDPGDLRITNGTDSVVLATGMGSVEPGVAAGGELLFASGGQLWRTDGTAEGTTMLVDVIDTRLECVSTTGDAAWFSHAEEDGYASWRVDLETEELHRIGSFGSVSAPCGFTSAGDGVVFLADAGDGGTEPWFSDGTELGTHLVADLAPDGASGGWEVAGTVAGRAVLVAWTPDTGTELFVTDGTTVDLVRDFTPGGGDTGLTVVGVLDDAVVLFVGEGIESDLWRTDGTSAGTFQLGVGGPLAEGAPFVHDGRLWFSTGNGAVSWWTDGTVFGTGALVEGLRVRTGTTLGVVAAIGHDLVVTDGGEPIARLDDALDDADGQDVVGAGERVYVTSGGEGAATLFALTWTVASTTTTSLPPTTATTMTPTSTTSTTVTPTTTTDPPPASSGGGGATPTTVAPTTTVAPRPTTVAPPTTSTPPTTTPPVSTGSGAVIVDEETGEIEEVPPATPEDETATGTVVTPDGTTISVTADGTIFSSTGEDLGDLADEDLNADIVGIALYTPVTKADDDELGYWLVGEDGGVFAFGSAPFLGSMGGVRLTSPVVGIVPSGRGYYLVAEDGGVFTFGSARFFGSLGDRVLNGPITSLTRSANGYWLVAADGGVFTFGDARFRGSLGTSGSPSPVVGLLPDADGYWLVRDDGTTARF